MAEFESGLLGCLTLTVFLLIVILVPLSFSYVEYYEYGLVMRKTTGRVDTDTVYTQGRYLLGPDKKFVKYQADAHFVEISDLSVFSAGTGDESIGLEFIIDADFTFFLQEDMIGEIHQELFGGYRTVIVSRAKSAIKNKAASVSFSEYFENRTVVEQRFREAVESRWNEKPAVHCTLDQFHLGRIRIPTSVADKQLQSRIQNEKNEQEEYIQLAKIEREQTGVEVNTILLEKEKLLRTARAEANLLTANARANAKRIIEEAQVNATQLLAQAAGISNQEELIAMIYIFALKKRRALNLQVSHWSPDSVVRTAAVQE